MRYDAYIKTVTVCPFCNGHNRIVAENDLAFLTYALAPYHRHHLLIIPKSHKTSLSEIDAAEGKAIDQLIHAGMRIVKNLGYIDYTILVREGLSVGKSVPHVHYHIVPKVSIGDLGHAGQHREVMTGAEIDSLMAELLAAT